ncbi:MAG: hypothetical protein QNK05_15170, partial [Myxococcota bacterium]|nr:hypothetical protein [Myxococcota bacterium]
EAFDAIASGDRRAALVAVEQAEEAKVALGLVLGEVLEDSARSADDASSLARRDSEIARVVLWVLMILGLAAAAGVFATVFRLVSDMRTLSGLLPMCAWCKKIRDDQGYWNQLESYLQQNSDAQLTHGLCQECQCEMHAKLEKGSEATATA